MKITQKERGFEYYRKESCVMLASDSGHSPTRLLLLNLLKENRVTDFSASNIAD